MLTICSDKQFRSVDLETLKSMPVPAAGNRTRWKGVQHADLARDIARSARAAGFELSNPQYVVRTEEGPRTERGQRQATDFIGGFELRRPGQDSTDGVSVLGWRHDNDSRRALQLFAGHRLFVCSNGIVSAEYRHHRKHTTGLQLRSWVDSVMGQLTGQFESQERDFDRLRQTTISNDTALAGFARLGRDSVLPWRCVGLATADWTTPRHEEFGPKTVWSWYNCANEAVKVLTPLRQPEALRQLWTAAQVLN